MNGWKDFFRINGNWCVSLYHYNDECGCKLEDMYQAFKERMLYKLNEEFIKMKEEMNE